MANFGVGSNPYIVPTNPPAIPQQMAPQPAQQTNTQPQTKCNAIWLHCTFDNGSEIPKEVLNYPKGPSEQLYFHDTDNPIIYMRETLGPITVAIAVDGATLNGTTMESTPTAVEEYNNVSRKATVPIFYNCCQTVTVRNTSPIPISVRNAIINIEQ